ncbi:N-acetylmuramoyl-L-alanine amidase [Streptomyces sp. TLI_171]|uniref:N-acetylmuramoyl-L-alanine amidase n=1 Tax=Streptomyces sp. TLI_171 TaxID=1938859 RepID=UPI000C65FA88|nr:peptidoglycan recognition family protein [Streptomyces sp. TLI_171]RKE20461.1 N-acetyl-anhydromuramyl-L-alanine amidase AmpD [Streptomyces sp. TLI_171]
MTGTSRPLVAAAGLALLATTALLPGPVRAAEAPTDRLQRQFADAAAEFGVPEGLLLAVSYQQTRWEAHGGEPSTTGNYNVMGLTHLDPPAPDAPTASTASTTPPAPPAARRQALHTLDAAAALLGRPADDLKTDLAQSVRGGAALLALYQRQSGAPASPDPADWYRAVVRFADPTASAATSPFADRVFATLRTGAGRRTAEGRTVRLPASPPAEAAPTLEAPTPGVAPDPAPDPAAECPPELGCDFRPAAYALTDPNDPTSYGNYTEADRPADGQQIQYLVVHDTEGGYEGAIATFQNPAAQASAHYLVRSSDGHVTQLVSNRHVAWHAGNKSVNMHSVGIEHEGYAFPTDRPTWYSEQLYRSSAELVRYLAARYGVPLDREHVIGHDDVPGPVQANVAGMHWDPGTFWDWSHFMDLVGAPVHSEPGPPVVGGTVVVAPAFDSTNQPPVNGISDRPENFVYLRTQPSADAPLLGGGTQDASDWRDKAVAGTRYVVAGVSGDWTAIWYDGQQAWFHNPQGRAAVPDTRPGRTVLTPRAGLASIPVYGRACPEAAAYLPYPAVPVQEVAPLSATVPAGQSYVALSAGPVRSDFYYARNIDGSAENDRTLVVGCDAYYAIRFNHRLAYLKSSDVQGGAPAPACR